MVLSFIYKINIILSDFFTGKTPKKSVTFVIVKVAVSDPDYPLDYKHYDYKYCYLNFKKKKKQCSCEWPNNFSGMYSICLNTREVFFLLLSKYWGLSFFFYLWVRIEAGFFLCKTKKWKLFVQSHVNKLHQTLPKECRTFQLKQKQFSKV